MFKDTIHYHFGSDSEPLDTERTDDEGEPPQFLIGNTDVYQDLAEASGINTTRELVSYQAVVRKGAQVLKLPLLSGKASSSSAQRLHNL